MIQVLCYTGRGFDTCWRPASVATGISTSFAYCEGVEVPYSSIRFFTGDFA